MGDLNVQDFMYELDDRGFDGFHPSNKYRYIQWAYREVGRMAEWRWLRQVATVAKSPPAYEITLGEGGDITNLRSLTSIWIAEQYPLVPMQPWDWYGNWSGLDLTDSQYRSQTQRYFLDRTGIKLIPPPGAATEYIVNYWRQPEDLLATSPTTTYPSSPPELDSAIMSLALKWCHKRANQWDLAMSEEREGERLTLNYLGDQEIEMYEAQSYHRLPDESWLSEFGELAWP